MKYLYLSVLAVSLAALSSCAKPRSSPEQAAAATSPYLMIRRDGVGLLDAGNNEWHLIKPEDLPKALAQLPPSAWPYGRVVAVREIGVRASGDDVLIRKNRGIVMGTLESLHVLVSLGPPSG